MNRSSISRAALCAGALGLAAPTAVAQEQPRFRASFGPGLDVQLVSRSLGSADLDGDGLLDLVLQREGGRLLRGSGKGAWRDDSHLLPADFGEASGAVVAGDLNGDGEVDLVATRAGQHESFLNSGLSFTAAGTVASLVANPPPAMPPRLGLWLVDVDLDGHLDLLQSAGAVVRLHGGDGTGQFPDAPVDLPFTLTGTLGSVVVRDVNLDGWPDVLAADDARTELLLGSAGGAFAGLLDLPLASPVVQFDIDGDGDFDLVGAEPGAAGLRAWRSDPGGAFALAVVPLAAAPVSLATADLNGDGSPDLVALLDGADPVGLENDGAGGFMVAAGAPVAGGLADAERLIALDLDLDGDSDLVGLVDPFGSGEAGAIALTSRDGGLTRIERDAVRHPLGDPDGLGDFDGDGRLDLVLPLTPDQAAVPGAVSSRMNLGFGTFVPSGSAPIVLPFDELAAYAAGDLDGDGRLDLLVGGRDDLQGAAPVELLVGDGAGGATLMAGFVGSTPRAVQDICLLDANGDGRTDAYLSVRDLNNATDFDVALANQLGTGLQASPFALPDYQGSSYTAEALDVELDGDLDLFLGQRPDPVAPWLRAQDTLLINNGNGVFNDQTAARLPLVQNVTRGVEPGDVDGDGDLDIAVFVDEGGSVDQPVANADQVLENNGGGFFGNAVAMPAQSLGDGPGALADIDFDGDLDLIEIAPGASRVTLFAGGGFGTERLLIDADAELPQGELAVADLDADGDPDLVHGKGLWRSLRSELAIGSVGSLGQTLSMEVTHLGPPSVWLLAYAAGGAFVELPPLGQLGLDLSAANQIVASGSVTPAETQSVLIPVPDLPQLVGVELHWQALVGFPLQLTRAVSGELDEL